MTDKTNKEDYDLGLPSKMRLVLMSVGIAVLCIGFVGFILYGSSMLIDSVVGGFAAG